MFFFKKLWQSILSKENERHKRKVAIEERKEMNEEREREEEKEKKESLLSQTSGIYF